MTLRILQMADYEPNPDLGAPGTDLMGAAALRNAGHEVEEVWTAELSHRIRHYNLRYLLELPYEYRKQVARRLRERRFDVVQISGPHGYLAARYVARTHPDVVFVHRSHGFEPAVAEALVAWRARYPDDRPAYRRAASMVLGRLLRRNIDGIARHAFGHLVYASTCADYLARHYAVERERIGIVPSGVPDDYCAAPRPMTDARARRILHVAQYAFFKAPHVVSAVASTVLARHPQVRFTWVCARQHHAEVRSLFEPRVRERITLLDWMPQDQLRDVYDRHGLFLFPSYYEGFGKAFLEAMSRGLVVVASDTGGMSDLIVPGRNGYLVPVGDVDGFVAVIERLLAAPGSLTEQSARAVELARCHTWARYAASVARFYADLIDARRAGSRR